mgnify:FL=1
MPAGIIHDLTKDKSKLARAYFDIRLPYLIEVYVTVAPKTGALVMGCLIFQMPAAKNPRGARSLSTDTMLPGESFRVAIPRVKVNPDEIQTLDAVRHFTKDVLKAWDDHSPANLSILCKRLFADHMEYGFVQTHRHESEVIFKSLWDFVRLLQGGWEYDPIRKAIVREGQALSDANLAARYTATPLPELDPGRIIGPSGKALIYPKES